MTQLSLVLLVLVIFGGYIADAREVDFKFKCPGAKGDVGLFPRGYKQHGDYVLIACCTSDKHLVDVNSNVFCCSGDAHCSGTNYDTCTCTGGKADTISPLTMSLIQVVS